MQLQVLREGSKGPLVLAWEEFLRDELTYLTEADGFFDIDTAAATRAFQKEHDLEVDGEVGNQTWGRAIQLGFHALEDDSDAKDGVNWPPKPSFGPTSYHTREKIFGHIEFKSAASVVNPEAVSFTNDWASKHIVKVEIPQLARIPGFKVGDQLVGTGPKGNIVELHDKVAQPMLKLWSRWEDAGILDRVLTWAGMWVPRFVRGSRTTLSNHAYGSAFDINAPWNGLQRTPALLGKRGCVRELVPIANELGWYWLGHNDARPDGMHFEATEAAFRI